MKIVFAPDDLRPIIRAVVSEVLAIVAPVRKRDRLAWKEAEAAELIGVARHVLRDCRLRGEITGSRVGKAVVYRREDLERFLVQQEIE